MMMLVRSCMGTPLPRVTSRNDNDNDDDAMINDNDNDNDNDDGDGDNDNATLSTQYSVLHLKQPKKKNQHQLPKSLPFHLDPNISCLIHVNLDKNPF